MKADIDMQDAAAASEYSKLPQAEQDVLPAKSQLSQDIETNNLFSCSNCASGCVASTLGICEGTSSTACASCTT